ncbi:MAG: hypothetical protein ACRCX8_05280 [Sarcina sp.]
MIDNKMTYTYSRLSIDNLGVVYVAENETSSIAEVKHTYMILDNEIEKKETRMKLSNKTFNILKEYFESTHGKKLKVIDIEKVNVVSSDLIPELEDNRMFVTIEEIEECFLTIFTMTLTEKCQDGRSHTIEISEETYMQLYKHHRG